MKNLRFIVFVLAVSSAAIVVQHVRTSTGHSALREGNGGPNCPAGKVCKP